MLLVRIYFTVIFEVLQLDILFLNLGLSWISSLPFDEPPSKNLAFLASLLFIFSLASSTCWTWTMRREMFILSCSIPEWYSSCNSSYTPVPKRSISFHGSKTIEGEYFDNLFNLKEYSSTLIPPWRSFMNSTTLALRFSRGKNLSRKSFLNTSTSSQILPGGMMAMKYRFCLCNRIPPLISRHIFV